MAVSSAQHQACKWKKIQILRIISIIFYIKYYKSEIIFTTIFTFCSDVLKGDVVQYTNKLNSKDSDETKDRKMDRLIKKDIQIGIYISR